ncbi:MAG: hypothetical protein RLN75_04545 [Longimicrobiales bacterium]
MSASTLLRWGVSLALVGLLAAASRVPIPALDADSAVVRLSWRLRAEEGAECRRPTQEELDRLPVHMRNPDACIGDLAPYELRVDVDGTARVSRIVRPAGVRGDRPIFVYDELRLAPGRHTLSVRFGVQDAGNDDDPVLSLETTVDLEGGRVLLVTRGADGALEARRPVR